MEVDEFIDTMNHCFVYFPIQSVQKLVAILLMLRRISSPEMMSCDVQLNNIFLLESFLLTI
jgi:hypothetical protein